MSLIFAIGEYPKFKIISTYYLGNLNSSVLDILNLLNSQYKLNACLCKMKLYEKKIGYNSSSNDGYTFSYRYNYDPNLKIEYYYDNATFLIAFEENNFCYCKYSKYELINKIQVLIKKNNEYLNKIHSFEKNIEFLKETEKNNRNKMKDYDEILKTLNELKEENSKLIKESSKDNEIKIELENEISQLNFEKNRLENEGKDKTKKLNDEMNKLKKQLKDKSENNEKKIENLKKEYNLEIEKINKKKEKLENITNKKIKSLEEINQSLIKEKENLNNEILNIKGDYENEIYKLNNEKENSKNYYENKLSNLKNEKEIEKEKYEKENKKNLVEINNLKNEKKIEKEKYEKENKQKLEEINNLKNEKKIEKEKYEKENKQKLEEINNLKNEKKKEKEKYEKENKQKLEELNNLKNEKKIEKEKYEKENQQKLEEINNLKNEKKIEKEKYEKENQQKLEEINNLKNEKKIEKEKYEKENKQKLEEINNLKNEKEIEKEKYEKENQQKLEEINKHKEKIEELNKEKEIIKKEGEILGSIDPGNLRILTKYGLIKNIKSNSNVLEIDSENRVKLNHYDTNNIVFEDFYDLIVNIKSIKDVDKGWELKMNNRGLENYQKYKKMKVIKIGIIGNSNKGKSFILSKLSKIKLPSGADIRTEGLSIKYPEIEEYKNRKIVLLDSAGLETPVLTEEIKEYIKDNIQENKNPVDNSKDKSNNSEDLNNNANDNNCNKDDPSIIDNNKKIDLNDNCEKAFKEKSKEKIMTELFLQNYIMHNSDILILVVGILTYSEQKLINRIKTEMKNQNIEKPLFIIHNLVLYDTVDKVEKHIENVLLKCATFKLEKAEKFNTGLETENGVHYYEKGSKPIIYHLIMANDISDAGEYYNPFTIKFIENSFQYLTDLSNYDVIESLKERFITLSKDYFEVPISKGELLDDESIFRNKKLSLKQNEKEKNDIQLKCCLIDELGFSNFRGNGFVPKYNYFKNGDFICLRVEVPGNYKINCGKLKYRGEYTIIPINGEKIKDGTPQKIEENLYTTREFGKFEVNIYLQTEKFNIKNEKVNPKTQNGVAVFNFALQTEEFDNEITSFTGL